MPPIMSLFLSGKVYKVEYFQGTYHWTLKIFTNIADCQNFVDFISHDLAWLCLNRTILPTFCLSCLISNTNLIIWTSIMFYRISRWPWSLQIIYCNGDYGK